MGDPNLGIISSDPLFVNVSNDDYHLQRGSPCFDVGDPNFVPDPNEVDMDGQPRVMAGRVDMGLDEFPDIPYIALGSGEISFSCLEGAGDPPSQILSIWNSGIDSLNWQITENCDWLTVDPNGGITTGEPNDVTLSVDVGRLAFGTSQCQFSITDTNAGNSPQTVDVSVSYKQRYPPGDIDMDYVVDIWDFGNLGGKWLFSGCVDPNWCDRADINHSTAVDEVDLFLMVANWQSDWSLYDDPNLVSLWSFEEGQGHVVKDSVGSNHGTLVNGSWVAGKVGGCLDFDGVDDYVIVPDDDSLTPSSALSISAWVYYRGGGDDIIVSKKAGGIYETYSPGESRAYYFSATSVNMQFRVMASLEAYDEIVEPNPIPSNEWHHIAVTFDNGEAKMYLDGQLVQSNSLTVSSIMNDDQLFMIGAYMDYSYGEIKARNFLTA